MLHRELLLRVLRQQLQRCECVTDVGPRMLGAIIKGTAHHYVMMISIASLIVCLLVLPVYAHCLCGFSDPALLYQCSNGSGAAYVCI